jgi:cysteine-rich repeat protein
MKRFTFLMIFAFGVACAQPQANGENDAGPTEDAGPEVVAQCGDNRVEGDEECDDGNRRNGDGCSARCRTEQGPECGDGVVDPGEECDDGNDSNDDSCTNDCTLASDGNDDMNSATPMENGRSEGVINPAGDVDYYAFEGEEGAWMSISTEANQQDDPSKVDTAITLYDAAGNQVADNDDAVPRRNTDSEILIKLPATGTYYVKVQEFSTWTQQDMADEGSPDYTYELTAFPLNIEAEIVTEDSEATEEGVAVLGTTDTGFGLGMGTFTATDEEDHFEITIPEAEEGGNRNVTFQLMPAGTDGYGSSANTVDMWVMNKADNSIVGRVSAAVGQDGEISPSLAPGDYRLTVAAPESLGDNAFYVFKIFVGSTDNDPELDEAGNNTADGAQALEFQDNNGRRSAFLMSILSEGDVDYYSFDLRQGETASFACGSRSSGTGVIDLTVAIEDLDGNEQGSWTELPNEMLYVRDAGITQPGTYLLKISAGSFDPEVTARNVRCGLHMNP